MAKVKGQFINNNTRTTAEKEIMKNHLTKHYNDIRDLNYNMMILKIKYNPVLELYLRKY